MADGFIFAAGLQEKSLPGWLRLQQLLVETGRPVEGFGAHLILQDTTGRGLDVEESLDTLRRWRDAGGTHASVSTMYRGYTGPAHHLDFLNEVLTRWDR